MSTATDLNAIPNKLESLVALILQASGGRGQLVVYAAMVQAAKAHIGNDGTVMYGLKENGDLVIGVVRTVGKKHDADSDECQESQL